MICRKKIPVIFFIFSALLLAGCSAYSVDSDTQYTPSFREAAGCWLSTDNLAVHDYSTGIDAYPQATCMELCIREDSTFDMVLAIVGNMDERDNVRKKISGTISSDSVDMLGAGGYSWDFHWTDGEYSDTITRSLVRLSGGKLWGFKPYLYARQDGVAFFDAYGEEDRKYSHTKDENACSRFDSSVGGL